MARKGKKTQKKIDARRADFYAMTSQVKIGDGHRDSRGYKCPGSEKK